MHYVLHPLLATFMSRKFRYTLTTKSQICQCHSQNAFTPIPPVPAEKVTRHLLFLICAWSASIVACGIHEGHARAHCSKERNDQSQHPENDANGTNHLRGWQLFEIKTPCLSSILQVFQFQPRNHQNQVTPTVHPRVSPRNLARLPVLLQDTTAQRQ